MPKLVERVSEIINALKKEAKISFEAPKLSRGQVEKGKEAAKDTAKVFSWIVVAAAVIAAAIWYYYWITRPPPSPPPPPPSLPNVVTPEILEKMSAPPDAELTIPVEKQSELLEKMSAPPVPPGKKAPQTPIPQNILKGMSAPEQ